MHQHITYTHTYLQSVPFDLSINANESDRIENSDLPGCKNIESNHLGLKIFLGGMSL